MTLAPEASAAITQRGGLLNALSVEEVYAILEDVCREALGREPHACYIARGDGSFERDPAGPGHATAPDRLDTAPPAERARVFAYRGRPLGAVCFDTDIELPEPWCAWLEEEFAPALFSSSYLASTLVENRRTKDQLYYLDEMAHRLGELDLDLLLVNILELTAGYLGADLASIILLRDGAPETAVDWGLPHEALISLRLRDGEEALASALSSRRARLFQQDEFDLGEAAPYNFDRLLILPLCTTDQTWGSINLVAPDRVRDTDDPHLEAVRSGVALAATAVENALLLEMKLQSEREQAQLRVGHQIQSALIPTEAPRVPGLDIAGSSVSATMIGGDYLDYFELPDGRTGMVVADVAGKGVPAGLIMTATRAMFRTAAIRHEDPGTILTEVNSLLCAEDFGGRFVTAIFLAIDCDSQHVEFATAGHDAPLVLRARDGSVASDPQPALPLGLRPSAEPGRGSFELETGDFLVAFTDGVTEAMDADRNQFSMESLEAVLRENAACSSASILEAIVAAIDQHCGAQPRHDDTTLIVVRRIDPTSEGTLP